MDRGNAADRASAHAGARAGCWAGADGYTGWDEVGFIFSSFALLRNGGWVLGRGDSGWSGVEG